MADRLENLAGELAESVQRLKADSGVPESVAKHRAAVAQAAAAILQVTKSPVEQLLELLVTFTENAAISLFIEWKAFDVVPSDGRISYEDLAVKLNADEALVARLAQFLVSTGLFSYDGSGIAHTERSRLYASGSFGNVMIPFGVEGILLPMHSFPEYFDKYGRKEPVSRYHTATAFAAGHPELTIWDLMNQSPVKKARMMSAMALFESSVPSMTSYSFDWVVAKGKDSPERRLVVDVGGGMGHALKTICERTPGLDIQRCVLEDLDPVLDAVRASDDPIRAAQLVPIDFHEEQPVKGACAYYISRCLHDYGDEECVIILTRLAEAMAPDSRLLIKEQLLDDPPNPQTAAADIMMMAIGGKERNLAGFTSITAKAGLSISNVSREEAFAIVECVKA